MLNQMNKKIIQVKNLTKLYDNTVAVDEVSFELEEKGFIFINGISGSGKTTLMNLLSGLDSPTSGEIYYNGKNITKCTSNELDDYRNSEIGVVFQNFNLIDDMTVEENLLLPLMIQEIPPEKKSELVSEALNYVGLSDYAKRKGYELSAGQKQRVAIARAIIKRPKVILADEATGNLDSKNTEQILKLFNNISKKCLVILISHDNSSAKKYADRIITLEEGKIHENIDNKQIKELYLEPYKISISGHNYSNEMYLEEFDIKSEIKRLGDKLGYKLEKYSFNTEIILEKEAETEEKEWVNIDETEIKYMPLIEILKCVARIIKKQKLKNVFVICLVAFISLLFFLINSFNSNDYYMSLSRYINNSSSSLYPVKMSILTENGEENDIYKGEEISLRLRQLVGVENVVESIGDMAFYKETDIFYATAFKYDELFERVAISGVWPLKSNEIAVAKELADKESISIGNYISDDEKEYVVVGIYSFENIMDGYNVVVSKEYDSELFTTSDFINLQACNILKSVSLDEYVSEIATIGNVSGIELEKLIWGRMPESENEIVISSNMLQQNGMTLEDGFITKYRLPNLQDEKYHNSYDDFVNMYRYLGKKVEVVGVYNSDGSKDYGDILVDKGSYSEIVNFYRKYLNFESLYVYFDYDNYDEIKGMTESNLYMCDDICMYIYAIQDFFNNMKDVMNIILIIALMMVILVIISFLSYNVKDYSKIIGIYKSLGIKNIDIVKIFMFYNLLLSVISIFVANIALHGVVYFVNKQIFLVLDMAKFEVFVINAFSCLIMSVIVVSISVLATIIPLINIVKKESVTLINRDNC